MSSKATIHRICVRVAITFAVAACGQAKAQLIATPNIEQLCRTAPVLTYRKTVVYVDVAAIKNASEEWGLTILNRLELAPREVVTVLAVNPNTFDVKEVFDSCIPTLSPPEVEDAQHSRGIWDRLFTLDPISQQREDLQTLDARLRNALDAIITESRQYQEGERRDILGAIAFDKNRYSDQSAFYRLIIYTDGTIKDPSIEGKSNGETQPLDALADRYHASFSGAEVAVFGVNGNLQDATLERKEQVFSAFFLKNWARLKSFSPSLPQQEAHLFPAAIRLDGVFEGGGTQGPLKLALFAVKQGNGADGWLAFNVGRETLYVPFQGEYHCSGNDCHLNATCDESVPPQSPTPYFRSGDRIVLSGKSGSSLEGSLQAAGHEVFNGGGNQTVNYTLKFSSQ
jgi:hypothetical protein